MTNKIKLSFKKELKPTGLYSVGHPFAETTIKVDGKKIGTILPPSWNTTDNWKISVAVKKDDPNHSHICDWRWARMGKDFDTESGARAWIKSMIVEISEIYTLHFFED